MGKVSKRDMQLTGQLPVIGMMLLVFLIVLFIADSISDSKTGFRTVIVEAKDCKTNTFLFEHGGELQCELIVVDHDNREVYGFIYRELANTTDEVKKLPDLPDIVNGYEFEVTYNQNDVTEFTAKPVGYETVFDMIE